MQELITRAKELLADGTVSRVLGWKKGDMGWDPEPAYFDKEEDLKDFVYNPFCGANLSKYLIAAGKLEGTTLVFLKPCDTYSLNELVKEHRVKREKTYIIGVGCHGTVKAEKVLNAGIKGIEDAAIEGDTLKVKTLYGEKEMPLMDALLERCQVCKGKTHVVFDELIGAEEGEEAGPGELAGNRFAKVEELEALSPKERFAFWQRELSKCIRCNACRNVCPACSCLKCVFDGNQFDSSQKANADTFEEQMFHIIRAYHVAGRCTDCGECSRVCPEGIPLQLLNRKFIKDINTFYGEYQAGADTESRAPLTDFTFEDVEPGIVSERGGGR